LQNLNVGNEQGGALLLYEFEVPEVAEYSGDRHAVYPDARANFGVRKRTRSTKASVCPMAVRAPIEQELRQLSGCGHLAVQVLHLCASQLVLPAQLAPHVLARDRVALKEVEKYAARKICELARDLRFGGRLIGAAGDHGGESKDFARYSDSDSETPAID
jgi:hypothetical protein